MMSNPSCAFYRYFLAAAGGCFLTLLELMPTGSPKDGNEIQVVESQESASATDNPGYYSDKIIESQFS